MEEKVLDLPLKKQWYEMQESGEKPEEYRDITPFWCNRLLCHAPLGLEYWSAILNIANEREDNTRLTSLIKENGTRGYTHIRLRYGYTKRTFTHKIDDIIIGYGNPKWGAPTDRQVFIIKHHKD